MPDHDAMYAEIEGLREKIRKLGHRSASQESRADKAEAKIEGLRLQLINLTHQTKLDEQEIGRLARQNRRLNGELSHERSIILNLKKQMREAADAKRKAIGERDALKAEFAQIESESWT